MRALWMVTLVGSLALLSGGCNGGGADAKEEGDDDDDTSGDDDDATGDDDDDDTSGDDDDDDDDTSGDDDDDDDDTVLLVLSAPEVVYGLANVDNEDDWRNEDPSDNDLVVLTIQPSETPADSIRLTVLDTQDVRAYYDGALVIDDGRDETITFPWQPDPVDLAIEFGEFDVDGQLLIEELDGNGDVVATAQTRLRSAPLLLNHHLQPAEHVMSTALDFGYADNDAFIATYESVLGKDFESANGFAYGFDPWMQDEFEFATGYLPNGEHMDTVIDSIRDRGLDDFAEDRWQGEDFGVLEFSPVAYPNSLDSFGNLEVAPPVDDYPFGRIYYGAVAVYGPNDQKLFDYLEDMALQDPFEVNTYWLCVGHVDEFVTFIPDSTAPRGFRMLFTDTHAAWSVLESMDPSTPLPRYSGRFNHDYDTVGELLADQGLRDENDDLQDDYLDPIRQQMIDELGLLPEEVVLFPGIFEQAGYYCGGTVAALIPGMVNLVVTDFGGTTQLFMADPFLRSNLGDQASDEMISYVDSILPAGIETYYLDDWDIYHLALGEVHCGSNVVRTPSFEDWWTNDIGGSN